MTRLQLRIGVLLALAILLCGWVMRAQNAPLRQGAITRTAGLEPDDAVAQAGQVKLVRQLDAASDDNKIALVTAQIMAHSDYRQHPLDATMSSEILDEYLNYLDPRHMYFLQSDIDEFNPWRSTLGEMLMKRGDITPAEKIFARFLQRLDQQTAYSNELLKNETFTFDGNDTFQLDRRKEPFPKDLDAAKQLWRGYLRYEYLQEKLNNQKPDEVVKTLTRHQANIARLEHEKDHTDVLSDYLNALAHAYDPHSDFLGKPSLDNFNIQMKLSVAGIGALLTSDEDGYPYIEQLIPGGPAIKSHQLKEKDKIVAVAQGNNGEPVDVIDMKIDNVVKLVRGPKGTVVRLTIIPAGAPDPSIRKTVTLVRDNVRLEEQEAKAELIEYPIGNGKSMHLGVINLPSFYADMDTRSGNRKSTTADVARLLKKLEAEKVDGVVLDLRGNPGGSLEEVINMTSLFVKPGPVVQVKSSDGSIQVDRDQSSPVFYDGPLVVLTSHLSASASEILAAALQDYGRALVVGDTSTFGKGTVQTIADLGQIMQRNNIEVSSNPGALKLTIQKFYRINGSSTQLKGVVPDIVLPSLTNYIDVGEKFLDHPLPWDTIPASAFHPLNRIQPVLPELKRRSEERVSHDNDFAYLNSEIDQFKKLMAQKSVSLNEQERLQEKRDAEARAKQRSEELKTHPDSKEKIYVLTLENIDKPGLPAPIGLKTFSKSNTQSATSSEDTTAPASGSDTTAAFDTTLNETEHILIDLIGLSAHPRVGSSK